MSKKPPLVYKRRCDHQYIAVVTMPGGRRIRRGTDCRHQDSAQQYAALLQRHVSRPAEEGGTLLPPSK